jgi:hypothetical protein
MFSLIFAPYIFTALRVISIFIFETSNYMVFFFNFGIYFEYSKSLTLKPFEISLVQINAKYETI